MGDELKESADLEQDWWWLNFRSHALPNSRSDVKLAYRAEETVFLRVSMPATDSDGHNSPANMVNVTRNEAAFPQAYNLMQCSVTANLTKQYEQYYEK